MLIELKNYVLTSKRTGKRLEPFDFGLAEGDACLLSSDSLDDALMFLKALATLIRPLKGDYLFKNAPVNFSNDSALLKIKKKIGFITSHSALISNRSIRENLLWIRAYHDNKMYTELDEETLALCELFSIQKMIDLLPSELSPRDCHVVITIRELAKSPEILLLEHPEDFIGLSNFGIFWGIMDKLLKRRLPMVFLSNSKSFIQAFSNRKLLIKQGKFTDS